MATKAVYRGVRGYGQCVFIVNAIFVRVEAEGRVLFLPPLAKLRL